MDGDKRYEEWERRHEAWRREFAQTHRLEYWGQVYFINSLYLGESELDADFASKARQRERMDVAVEAMAKELGFGRDEVEAYLKDRLYVYSNVDCNMKEFFEPGTMRFWVGKPGWGSKEDGRT